MSSIIEKVKSKASGTPAGEKAVQDAERAIGAPFPQLLKDIYLGVANGGIGPGYHILGVDGGHLSDEGDTISELYLSLAEEDPFDPLWQWPDGLVPFCEWGSAICSCYNSKDPGNPVVWFDPNKREMGEPMEQQFTPHRASLESWLNGWLEGEDLWAEK